MADTSFIIWVQQFASPFLDGFFKAVTFMGDQEFYMLTIPLFFWLLDKKFGIRFAIIYLISAYTNSTIKHNFVTERPPLELHKIDQGGYSFPSGHAQGNTLFWGFLAYQMNKRWAYITAAVIVALGSFSRIYLGVHYPIDIIFGILIGITLIALFEFFSRNLEMEVSRTTWFLVSLGAVMLLLFNHTDGDGPVSMGFLLGALWGYRLEADFVGFSPKGNWWQNILKVVIGIGVFFWLRGATSALLLDILGFSSEGLWGVAVNFIRYFIMAFWVIFFAPWLFKLLRLYKVDSEVKKAAA